MQINSLEITEDWRKARLMILYSRVKAGLGETSETILITKVEKSDQPYVLKALYETGKKLGLELVRKMERRFTINEVIEILSHSKVPCFQGKWDKENHSLSNFLYRGTCPEVPLLFCCDYWREAARGFVHGLNDELEFSRHRSIGHKDDECMDYVYMTPMIDRRKGVVPSYLRRKLHPLVHRMKEGGISLKIEGCSEHTLYLSMEADRLPLTTLERESALRRVFHDIKEILPEYDLVESPNS